MKSNLIKLSVFGCLLLSSSLALGMEFDVKPYIGADIQYNNYRSTKRILENDGYVISRDNNKMFFSRSGAGIGGFIGLNFNENFALELGGQKFLKQKTTDNDGVFKEKFVAKQMNCYADILGITPIAEGFDFVGSIGVGRLSTKFNYKLLENGVLVKNGFFNKTFRKTRLRLGLGTQYLFCNNVGARLMFRYQHGNQLVKYVTSVGLGLFYQFK